MTGGTPRSFGYDSLSRLQWATNPESGTTAYSYDDNGNLEVQTYSDLGTITHVYDDLNRLTRKVYSDGVTPQVDLCYDGKTYSAPLGCTGNAAGQAGRLTGVSNAYSSTVYSYDGLGRVVSSTQTPAGSSGYTFNYTHYRAGVSSVQYPSQRVVATCYDRAGRPKWVSAQKTAANCVANSHPSPASQAYALNVEYWAHGAVKKNQLGNGHWEYVDEDLSRLWPKELRLGTIADASDLWKLVNEYSGEGDVAKQVLTFPATPSPRTLTTRYLYDGVHRLALAAENPTNVTSPTCPDAGSAWCEKFGYDQPGNRSIIVGSNISYSLRGVPETFDANNRITGPGTGWWYNSRGLLLRNANTPVNETYNYDLENRLRVFCTQTSDPALCTFTTAGSLQGTGKTQYYYDGEGRRVKKDEGGAITTFVYDAFGRLAAEYPGTTLTAGIRYRTTDHLGTTRVLTDGNGQVVLRQDYLAFGDTTPSTTARLNVTGYGQALDRIQFTGKERDAETGLDYFGARYMSSAQGRFTSPDPHNILTEASSEEEFAGFISNPQNWNKYSYVTNNPLSMTDPDGRCPSCLIWLQQLAQRAAPYADKAGQAAQRWGSQASQAAQRYGQQAYVWATQFFNSPTGQEVTQTAIETAVGYQGPSPTVTGNVGRLAKAEFETGVRLAQKLGQSVRVSEHVGAEFVSAAGKTFDALGTPQAYQFWNQGQFLKSIDKHLLKSNDFTVIDLTGANKAQVAAIQKHVSSLAKELQDKILYVGN